MAIFLIFAALSNSAIKKHFICTLNNANYYKITKQMKVLLCVVSCLLYFTGFIFPSEFVDYGSIDKVYIVVCFPSCSEILLIRAEKKSIFFEILYQFYFRERKCFPMCLYKGIFGGQFLCMSN